MLRSFLIVLAPIHLHFAIFNFQFSIPSALAQNPTPPSSAQSKIPNPKSQIQPPPLPPSPVEQFRQLLAMTPDQRDKTLATRPPKTRQVLEAKLTEYQNLSPVQRDHRLHTLELRYYLLPLLTNTASGPTQVAQPSNPPPSTLRSPSPIAATEDGSTNNPLSTVPEPYRSLIAPRLQWWRQLPPDQQRDILQCQPALDALTRPQPPPLPPPLAQPSTNNQLSTSLAYLNNLPPEQRAQTYRNLATLLNWTQNQRARALAALPVQPWERAQIQRTLQTLANLPKPDRDQSIAGLQKFTALSPEAREQFLKDAQRWQTMTPQDRALWRSLVLRKTIPMPPLPPGLTNPAARLKPSELQIAVDTNR